MFIYAMLLHYCHSSSTICTSTTKKGSVGEEDTLVDFPLLFLVEAKGANETLMLFMTQEKPFILYKTSKTRAQTNEGVWLSKKEV